MQGLMQDYPLAIPHIFERAERMFGRKEIATARAGGQVERTTYEEWSRRVRLLGGALDVLEISGAGRVGSFAWNTGRHLELYFAAPCTGRVRTRAAISRSSSIAAVARSRFAKRV